MAKSILGQLLFEKKPTLPDLPSIDFGKEQQKAIASNIAAQPEAQKLAASENLFNFNQLQGMLEKAIPFYQQLKEQTSANVSSLLKGEIPADVASQIQRNAAAKAIGGGYAGSGIHGSLLARDLGMTSLALTEKGITAAESWMASAANQVPRMFDASTMFVTPQQQYQADVQERATQFNYQWFKNQLAAQPEPWEKAVEGFLDYWATLWEGVGSAYIGGVAGGVGGGGVGGMGGLMGGAGGGGGGGGGGGE